MRCNQAKTLMDRYVNEGLPLHERESFETHLRVCPDCQGQLESLQGLLAVLQSDPSPPVPQGFVGRVMARAERETIVALSKPESSMASRSVWKRLGSSAGITSALAAGLIVGLFMGYETWRDAPEQGLVAETSPADPLAASGFEHLVEPGGVSLAQGYLGLTAPPNH
jgi:anti-sigma factor RsiW